MQSRKSTKALLKAATAAREKTVIKLEGLQKEEMDLTLLLLRFFDGSVSHVSSSASCCAPLSPQQWALGLAAWLSEDVRVKFEEWYKSVEIEAKASVDPYSEVLSQESPATSLQTDPVSSTPIAATSTGSAFRAAKAPFSSQRASTFQMSKSKERPPGADQIVNAVGCRRSSGSPSPGSARVTAGPAEQDSELCTMADFSRRVPLDELRGRGLMKGLQPEVLEQISRWPSAHAHGDVNRVHGCLGVYDKSLAKTGGRGWVGSRYLCR